MADFYFPGPVPTDALAYFRAKGWQIGFDYRDVWKAEHASSFTVAKAMEMDVLADIREAVDKAIEGGQTFQQFAKELKPTLQKRGWWGVKEMVDPETGEVVEAQLGSPRRLKTIYRANMRTARASAQWERARRTKKLRPYFLYQLGPSANHREEHVAWHNIILPVDDPFWLTHFPPNGWGCKCFVRQITEREAQRLGGVTKRPEVVMRQWENKRTGEAVEVPEGIDPGWDWNPGKARIDALSEVFDEKLTAAHPADAKAARMLWDG
ncbi:phage protein [Desulfoluna limicola]|uniref:Phage protein n=1 Tax=Desulfoluna limicola TaxID=2810562 RepID=A0ABN6EZF1_9BACT|nr:phage minor head protein [Desulfoluna limicola]BCS94607.1 phage protein [Desulfoluna limicola]